MKRQIKYVSNVVHTDGWQKDDLYIEQRTWELLTAAALDSVTVHPSGAVCIQEKKGCTIDESQNQTKKYTVNMKALVFVVIRVI